jgi:methyl-accepting chemotaxis protein
MNRTSAVTAPGPVRFRFRWTIARKITALVVLAIVLTAGIGLLAVTSVASLQRLAVGQAALATARGTLIDLDLQESNSTIALNRAILATTDAERQHAAELLTDATAAAKKDIDRIRALDLPTAASAKLATILTGYEQYLAGMQAAVAAAAPVDPASPAGKTALAADDKQATASEQEISDGRAMLTVLVDRSVAQASAKATSVEVTVVATLVAATVLLTAIGWTLVRTVRRALYALRDRMADIAEGEGDLTARLDDQASDETGEVALAVNKFIVRVQDLIRQMSGAADTLEGSVQTLSAMTAQMSANADETSSQAAAVTHSAEDVSRNVSTLSAGSEQMSASIREISMNASEAAQVATTAVGIASTARDTVAQLAAASTEIGNVVKLITSIAEQTNLLALNATIEAARAGESGKGFAVVAGEVKELAQETAKATDDITQRVTAIQAGTNAAVEAISTISDIVARISDFSTTIASAVEEQTATTNEMSRSVTEAADSATQIATNITDVSAGASSTSEAATEASRTTQTVATVVGNLKSTVDQFRY